MSDDFLFAQLFSQPAPPKVQKKEGNADIFNSLFEIDLPAPKKKEPQIKKNKHEDEINQYIAGIHKNTTASSQPKYKEQHAARVQPVPNKPSSSSISAKPSTPKPVERVQERKEAKYMPTVVDIFAKKQEKSAKAKPIVQKSESSKVRPTEERSKVEAKRQKIQRKQIQNNNKPKQAAKPTPRPQTNDRPKKELKQPERQRPVQKQRPKKKKKQSSSESSSGSSSQQSDWRKELRNITGYNPGDRKFRERDHMEIKQSGVDRIFGQDKFSFKMGRREQEEDLRLEEMRRLKKLKQKEHRH